MSHSASFHQLEKKKDSSPAKAFNELSDLISNDDDLVENSGMCDQTDMTVRSIVQPKMKKTTDQVEYFDFAFLNNMDGCETVCSDIMKDPVIVEELNHETSELENPVSEIVKQKYQDLVSLLETCQINDVSGEVRHCKANDDIVAETVHGDDEELKFHLECIDALLNPESTTSNRAVQKWSSMFNRKLNVFLEKHRGTFSRRLSRGVPQKYRWEAWQCLTESYLKTKPSLANYEKFAESNGSYSNLITIDISRTFPEMPFFSKDAQKMLCRILNGFSNCHTDIGYCQGMNFIVGLLLIVNKFNSEFAVYNVLCGLMDGYYLGGFYRPQFPLLKRFIKMFDELAIEHIPEIRAHFKNEGVMPAVYLHQWFLTMFVGCLPLGTVVVIWDYVISRGLVVVIPVSIAILKLLQKVLLRFKFESILRFLKLLKHSTYQHPSASSHNIKNSSSRSSMLHHYSMSAKTDFKVGRILVKEAEKIFQASSVLKGLELDTNSDERSDSSESYGSKRIGVEPQNKSNVLPVEMIDLGRLQLRNNELL